MNDSPRLIERAFPLKQTSLDSVHEKNVRHGHISTLHIWPARRPLAACRAALIATLLPDPGTPEERRRLCEKIGGVVKKKIERKKMPDGSIVEREKEETEGGILHWGLETENAKDMEWFRQEIKKAYGGRAPRVLDPFAGGGAIPLEAMRLGCETMAMDINPVAWFLLKCTLEYPQKLAGKTHPLPNFILEDDDFMDSFYKAHPELVGRTKKTKTQKVKEEDKPNLFDKPDTGRVPKADLAWHVRAWGKWVLNKARKELAKYYPTYADFEPLDWKNAKPFERQPMKLVPLDNHGNADIHGLNYEFSDKYLRDDRNPRWVAKPTVAYLWARTVSCKNCRATVPLLKTRWLCKKDKKRILLNVKPNSERTGVEFSVETNVLEKGGNAAQKREHDKRLGEGTMSAAGARCPCCETIMTMDDIQYSALSDKWSEVGFAVVVDGQSGKEYRAMGQSEYDGYNEAFKDELSTESQDPLDEPIDATRPSPNARGLSGLTRYGINKFKKVFNSRQRLSLLSFSKITRLVWEEVSSQFPDGWSEGVLGELALGIDRVADRNSTLCHWDQGRETISNTFQRYALRVNWDYCEVNPFATTTGNYLDAVEWICRCVDHALQLCKNGENVQVKWGSARKVDELVNEVDLVLTDPPYYDAIPYADLSDFFYIWMRRVLRDRFPKEFESQVTIKDEELIQHASHGNGNNSMAKQWYEEGMAETFSSIFRALKNTGRFVVVFAHKNPDAWEALAGAIVRAGFVVNGSWPIQTEMPNKAAGGARLASSVWLICKKRPLDARPGWDNRVLEEMRINIATQLREFWDAGIRGPDFVWAATGPALEAYSKHPVVKKANDPGQVMGVGEFLTHVRRMVVDFVVGQLLVGGQGVDLSASDRMDAATAYYLLHRHDFGQGDAPAGACILYATACGLSDHDLENNWDILVRTGGKIHDNDGDDSEESDEAGPETGSESGSKVKLKAWSQRKNKSMGYEAPGGQPVPLVDRVHRLMHLWKSGDISKVDGYLDDNALRRHELFKRLLQSLIELSRKENQKDELQLLESLSNHIGMRGAPVERVQTELV